MGKTIQDLEKCFEDARKYRAKFIAVKIEMEGFAEPEIIINPRQNFKEKLAYYKRAYNDDLILKTFNGIRIIDFKYGVTYSEFEFYLVDDREGN
jgi:hypothetical protein